MVEVRTAISILVGTQIASIIIIRSLMKDLARQRREYARLFDMTQYIAHICDEQDVDLSEFDRIALDLLLNKD